MSELNEDNLMEMAQKDEIMENDYFGGYKCFRNRLIECDHRD